MFDDQPVQPPAGRQALRRAIFPSVGQASRRIFFRRDRGVGTIEEKIPTPPSALLAGALKPKTTPKFMENAAEPALITLTPPEYYSAGF